MIVRQLLPVDALAWRAFRLEMFSEAPAAFASTFAEIAVRPLDSFAEWLDQIHLFAALDGEIFGSVGWYLPKEDGAKKRHCYCSLFATEIAWQRNYRQID